KRPKENPWHSLAETLADREPLQDPGAQVAPQRPEVSVSVDDVKSARDEINKRWAQICEPTFEVRAIKELAIKEKQTDSEPKGEAITTVDQVLLSEETEDQPADEGGVAWGEDIHELLEAAMRGRDAGLKSLALSLTRERAGVVDEDKRVQR